MKYTVAKLAKLSGVSIRTLHWYDQTGLLKPSFYGDNKYRYYEEEQLLLLQQILFFRNLGFPLDEIQKLLSQDDFDKQKSLTAHRKILEEDLNRKKLMIETIDRTLAHLRGEQVMKDNEIYYGLDSNKQKEYEQYLVHYHGHSAEDLLKKSQKRVAKWGKDEWQDVKNQGDLIYKELTLAIEKKIDPKSEVVQAIIDRHYRLQNRFFDLTKEIYIGLTQLYADHPDFKKFFDVYHPKMIEYLGQAIRIYAEKNLK